MSIEAPPAVRRASAASGRCAADSVELSREQKARLIARIKTGDQAAPAELVHRFAPKLMMVVRRFTRCEADCHDVLQDAFIAAFKGLPHFKADSRLSSWLHRITINCCLMKLRSRRSRKEYSMDGRYPTFSRRGRDMRRLVGSADPTVQVETDETCDAVRRAIDVLPDAYRTVLLLRDIEEMSTADTATMLETTEADVKIRLHRARKFLCQRLAPTQDREMVASR